MADTTEQTATQEAQNLYPAKIEDVQDLHPVRAEQKMTPSVQENGNSAEDRVYTENEANLLTSLSEYGKDPKKETLKAFATDLKTLMEDYIATGLTEKQAAEKANSFLADQIDAAQKNGVDAHIIENFKVMEKASHQYFENLQAGKSAEPSQLAPASVEAEDVSYEIVDEESHEDTAVAPVPAQKNAEKDVAPAAPAAPAQEETKDATETEAPAPEEESTKKGNSKDDDSSVIVSKKYFYRDKDGNVFETDKDGNILRQVEDPEKDKNNENEGEKVLTLTGVNTNSGENVNDNFQPTDDLEQQMWNSAWKNKLLGFDYDEEEHGHPCPYVPIRAETVRYHKSPVEYSTAKLESGSRINNYKDKVGLTYEGEPKFEDCLTAVRMAQEKGWKAAKLDGPDEYKKQMYLAMRAMGMTPVGYTPSKEVELEGNKLAREYAKDREEIKAMNEQYPELDAARQKVQSNIKDPVEAYYRYDSTTHKSVREAVPLKTGEKALDDKAQEKAPEEKAKDEKAPEEKAPEAKAPEAKAPEAKAPEAKAPEAKAPEEKAPEAKVPEAKAPEEKAPEAKVSQNMQEVMSEMAKTTGANIDSKDSKEAEKAAIQMGKGFKSMSPELQKKFGKMVDSVVENHPEVAKQLIRDLNSDGKQGPARALKAYGKAMTSIKEAEAKGEKTTTRVSAQQKQDMTQKIIKGLKKNTRG